MFWAAIYAIPKTSWTLVNHRLLLLSELSPDLWVGEALSAKDLDEKEWPLKILIKKSPKPVKHFHTEQEKTLKKLL